MRTRKRKKLEGMPHGGYDGGRTSKKESCVTSGAASSKAG